MKSFAYVTAQSATSAVALVREDGKFLAGGMDLLGEMKESLLAPKTLVNIKALPDSRAIRAAAGILSVGANVTLAELAEHPEIRSRYGALAEAAAEVGSPQIRNVATLGGNLAQHSRCWYYRHRDISCRKKGGKTCYARQGESKYHALFTGNMCVSPCVSNLAVALAALDARIVVQRGHKLETLKIAQLYDAAWRTPTAHNSLRADDLIVRIELLDTSAARSAYLQVGEKADFDWALVSCAVAAGFAGGNLVKPRVVLGAIAPVPWQLDEANAFLEGKPPTAANAERAADLLLRDARPFADNAYKLTIAKALVRRAMLRLVA